MHWYMKYHHSKPIVTPVSVFETDTASNDFGMAFSRGGDETALRFGDRTPLLSNRISGLKVNGMRQSSDENPS